MSSTPPDGRTPGSEHPDEPNQPDGRPSERAWKAQLARAFARRARAEADFYATVAEIGATVPQTQIAAALHTNQSTVSRWATRGRQQTPPGQLGRNAYEVAQRFAAGEITREQMLEALTRWPYRPSTPPPVEEWNITPAPAAAGSFEAAVGRAYDDGLLTAEDYDAILDALAASEHDASAGKKPT